MTFIFERLEIPDVILITPDKFEDQRGFFMETYKKSEFEKYGIPTEFMQDNHSNSRKNVIRGLHYQLNPKPQGKLVRVINGRGFDVAVDIRLGSPTYGKWIGVELSKNIHRILWVPPGFAHGILTLEENTELLYKVTEEYDPLLDRCLNFNDEILGINWPIQNPMCSEKDKMAPKLGEIENNFTFSSNSHF